MKKLFLFLIIGMFLISGISAFTFDNVLSYEKNDMKVSFDNLFGLGTHYGEIELKSHKTTDEVLIFTKNTWETTIFYDFTNWELYKNGLGDVKFIDMKIGKEIEKEYTFVEWKGDEWIKYDSKDIPNRNVRIGIKVFIEEGDYIDVVWTIIGKEVTKHAQYAEGEYDTFFSIAGVTPSGLAIIGDYAYIDSYTGGTTFQFFVSNFTATGTSFSTTSYNADMGTDGTYLWYGSDTGNVITKYWTNGTVISSFSTIAQGDPGNPKGATSDGTSVWVMNYHLYIDRYNMAGAYQDRWNTGFSPSGIDENGTFMWLSDDTANQIKKYFMNGTLISAFDLNAGNSDARGIHVIDKYIYVADNDGNVYRYSVQDYIEVPVVTLNSPVNYTNYTTTREVSFNCTAWDVDELINVSLMLDGVVNETNSSGFNDTFYTFTKKLLEGDTYWSCRAANNYSQFTTAGERLVTIDLIVEEETFYNVNTYETAQETFTINITTNGTQTVSAELFYNGVGKGTSTKTGTDTNANYSNTIQLPEGVGTKEFLWQVNIGGIKYNTTIRTQTISPIQFGLCNATLTVPYLNISFKDEADLSVINATISTSSFVYYLGDGTIYKTYSLINNTLNYYYNFCSSPANRIYHIDPYVQYVSTGYPQRIWNPDVASYTNSTTNQTLYLLSSENGIYVTFQVINSADQLLSGVDITAVRSISGTDTTVASGTTSASGIVTFWLNPDFSHTFSFVKSGYTTYTYSEAPTQTSYTITLPGGVTTTDDYSRGMKLYTYPKGELTNDTSYNFIFNLTSDYWEIDSFGFDLRLKNGTIITGDTSATEGTGATLTYDVNNQSIIYMDYYWIIEGNTSIGTTYWVVTNSLYTDWSIKTFFVDLGLYLDSGIFGLDNFGRYLITFLILFISVGIFSFKYGFTSPVPLTILTFSIVFFLDIVVGLIPQIRGIDYLVTYLAGLIMIVTIIGEVSR